MPDPPRWPWEPPDRFRRRRDHPSRLLPAAGWALLAAGYGWLGAHLAGRYGAAGGVLAGICGGLLCRWAVSAITRGRSHGSRREDADRPRRVPQGRPAPAEPDSARGDRDRACGG